MRRTVASRYVLMAAVMAATSLLGVRSSHAQVEQRLAEACVAGHQAACTRLMKIAHRACLNGNSDWCSIAAQLAAVQEPDTPQRLAEACVARPPDGMHPSDEDSAQGLPQRQ